MKLDSGILITDHSYYLSKNHCQLTRLDCLILEENSFVSIIIEKKCLTEKLAAYIAFMMTYLYT